MAEQGKPVFQYLLSRLYHNGEGVPRDYAEAMKWGRLAADQGLADAQLSVGFMYAEGQGAPKTTPKLQSGIALRQTKG